MTTTSNQTPNILKIDASARREGSTSRELTHRMASALKEHHPQAEVTVRDTAEGLPFINDAWVTANFTPNESRTQEQREILALSDQLVAELKAADYLVIGTPIYNFGIPASLKAWVDLICRARETFRYTEDGPMGLLKGKKAFVAVSSGGTRLHSEIDFAGGYLRQMLKFVGIEDVTFIEADAQMVEGEARMVSARRQVDRAAATTAGMSVL